MDSTPDFYTVLGVPEHINQTGIRRAYLQKAWQCHPDVNPNAVESATEMRAVNQAYATLSNPSARAVYDARRRSVFVTQGPLLNNSPVVYVDVWASGRARGRASSHRYKGDQSLLGLTSLVFRRFCRYLAG